MQDIFELLPMLRLLSFYEFLGEQMVKLPFSVIRFGAEERWQLITEYLEYQVLTKKNRLIRFLPVRARR